MPKQKRGGLKNTAPDASVSLPPDNTAPETETDAYAAMALALRFISYRPRSVKETIQKLNDNGFTGGAATDTVNYLASAGYLDDERYARELAGSRIRNKNWGVKKIALDLHAKGIPDKAIHAALSNIDASADADTAGRALGKWMSKAGITFPLEKKEFEKAFRHLAARGFSAQVIMGLLKNNKETEK